MNSRQRVLLALQNKVPDRVPTDLLNTASFINDPALFALRKHLGLKGDVKPFRRGFTSNYYDEELLEKLAVDFRHVWLNAPLENSTSELVDGNHLDEWGIHYRFLGDERAIVKHPLQELDAADIDSYNWPDPYAKGRVDGLEEKARYYFECTEYAVAAHAIHGLGFFDHAWILRGFGHFMNDLMVNKYFVKKLLNKLLEVYQGFMDNYLNAVGPYIQLIVHAEDYGMQNAPFISPKMYTELFLPVHKEYFSFIKSKAPQVKIMLHSCGSVYPLIPHFIEAGIDVINPVQPLAFQMNPRDIKKEFGENLVIHGGIDVQHTIYGSVEDVKREVQERVAELGALGGYILAPANNFQSDVQPQNIETIYCTAANIVLDTKSKN